MGIEAFAAKSFDSALEHFNKALKLEPLNSGAQLNRIQVYIQLFKKSSGATRKSRLSICENSFIPLSNTNLPEEHDKRYKTLKKEFMDLKTR